MKLSLSLLLASLASTASATQSVSAANAAKVLRAARRVEDAAAAEEAEPSYDFLAKYSLKLIGCKSGVQVQDAETGEYEYNAAMFRLCPTESGCSDSKVQGCDKGYGDFVVGLNTFVNAYFEDQRDNMQWDDQFQVDRYAECGEYKVEKGDDDTYADQAFYVGPTCTEDELGVRLALFSEETCTTFSDVAFEAISNGWSLPFSSGGMVSNYCSECVEYDENAAAYQTRDYCEQLYTESAYGCESSMEYFSYYGQNVQGCEYIKENTPAAIKRASGKGGKVFGWLLFVVVLVGGAGYVMWWRKKKQTSAGSPSAGLVA